ncbi:MAG: hypothetical protein F4184_05210 [Gemmatimonadetes bacterium]|nr:hypothetical protein [Gemmatimonadota bacterium]
MNALRTTWTMGLVLLLVAASEANSGDIQVLPEDSRIFYVFSHDRAPQRQRVLQLWQQFSAQDAEQRFIAIARDGQMLTEVEGLTLWSTAMAAQSPEVPAYIKARLDADGDYFAAVDSEGTLHLVGLGQNLLRPLSTEVDESTWGKVKDLFK